MNLVTKGLELDKLGADDATYEQWKKSIFSYISPKNIKKINLINPIDDDMVGLFSYFNEHKVKCIKAILADEEYKKLTDGRKKDLEILKLMKAREEDFDFEVKIAEIICGDNHKFPYKKGYEISDFFQELGYNYTHDGSTRKWWVCNKLKESNSVQIHQFITEGVFKRKYFVESGKNIEEAKDEFKTIIENCCLANSVIDISDSFGLNIKNELLFNKETQTSDATFNELVDKSKKIFLKGDKQIALEKIWDAFERIKTLISEDKRYVAKKLIELGSKIEEKDIDNEFKSLTEIGNIYQIRHFEKGKRPIKNDIEKEYFYFRVLSLIDYCLSNLNSKENL